MLYSIVSLTCSSFSVIVWADLRIYSSCHRWISLICPMLAWLPANLYFKYFSRLAINSARKRAVRVQSSLKQLITCFSSCSYFQPENYALQSWDWGCSAEVVLHRSNIADMFQNVKKIQPFYEISMLWLVCTAHLSWLILLDCCSFILTAWYVTKKPLSFSSYDR